MEEVIPLGIWVSPTFWHCTKLESLYGDVGQDGLFILKSNVNTELISPSLTGTETDCFFGEVGHIFCALIKVL